jgi:arylsulfatase A-like enzyme
MLSRRHFFFGSLALPAVAARKPAVERPNVLLLVADFVPSWALGVYGNKEFRTPNLDRLAQTGTRFLNHISAAPAPGPGRATLVTGRTPMQLGEAGAVAAGDATLASLLGGAGYGCHAAGGASPADVAKETLKLLEAQRPGAPFFIEAAFAGLQVPYSGVPSRFAEQYAGANFNGVGYEPAAANAREGREMLAAPVVGLRQYGAALSALDESAGAIVGRLGERKLADSTLVIFTAACGSLLGRHGLWGAGDASAPPNMFEESVRTPLFWSWLGRTPAQGSRPEVVSAYDLVPSVCEAAGIAAPSRNLCGRSYVALATGQRLPKKQPWRNTVFARYRNTAMAREDRYKLVERDGGKGAGELYDLAVDPREKSNQYANQQFVTVRATLSGDLARWAERYSK